MCKSFSYSVTTILPRERVFDLLADVDNWAKVSIVYHYVRWSGSPWYPDSCLFGQIKYPVSLPFRYVLERFEPPSLVSYMAHSTEAGFATHRTIELAQLNDRTLLKVTSYAVGEPKLAIPDGALGFLRLLTERWFQDFARFCDDKAHQLKSGSALQSAAENPAAGRRVALPVVSR